MKCEVCLELLEEYLDGELTAAEQEQVGTHLITCADCSGQFAKLTAEQELFARYDREVEVPPFLWTRVAAHTVSENAPKRSWFGGLFARPATAIAIVLLAITLGVVYLKQKNPKLPRYGTDPGQAQDQSPKPATTDQRPKAAVTEPSKPEFVASKQQPKRRVRPTTATLDQSGVLSSDFGYLDIDEQDTAKHIEQTQNLLRSIKNLPVSDGDDEIDVSYDKALSRRLLNENVVLRRDAEMKAKFPTKTLLADLEPFLIDIANLPDRARPEDVRVIKERVQKTEIVAALLDFQDRGTNNR
jgi:hypothetical protein